MGNCPFRVAARASALAHATDPEQDIARARSIGELHDRMNQFPQTRTRRAVRQAAAEMDEVPPMSTLIAPVRRSGLLPAAALTGTFCEGDIVLVRQTRRLSSSLSCSRLRIPRSAIQAQERTGADMSFGHQEEAGRRR